MCAWEMAETGPAFSFDPNVFQPCQPSGRWSRNHAASGPARVSPSSVSSRGKQHFLPLTFCTNPFQPPAHRR